MLWGKQFWGDNFFITRREGTENAEQAEATLSYFVGEIEKHARYAVPFVKNLKCLMRWLNEIKYKVTNL